jgi:hypothetical protein
MRKSILVLTASAGIAALAAFSGCSGDGGPPRVGDTVTPVLAGGLQWTAGQPGEIGVRLQARNKDGSAARVLGFNGIPTGADPVATITFYDGDQPLSPVAVMLSHRC